VFHRLNFASICRYCFVCKRPYLILGGVSTAIWTRKRIPYQQSFLARFQEYSLPMFHSVIVIWELKSF
jgi:hypothetical protein